MEAIIDAVPEPVTQLICRLCCFEVVEHDGDGGWGAGGAEVAVDADGSCGLECGGGVGNGELSGGRFGGSGFPNFGLDGGR